MVKEGLTMTTKFNLGKIVTTPGALRAAIKDGMEKFSLGSLLTRHKRGDWGDLEAEDKAANDAAVKDGDRILSAYVMVDGTKFWIITEADRSVTTILLPEEY
jgi:hypothetical protein